VGPSAFKAAGTGDPRPAGSIPVHLRHELARVSTRWRLRSKALFQQGVNDNIVPLPVGQPDSTSNAGCEDADFAAFTGDIALIQRGTCFFFEKIANAVEAGADAVIIFNEGNSPEREGVDFGQASFPRRCPSSR
jgi:hypothetical protein